MAKTPELDLPVAEQYIALLKREVEEIGRNRIAELAGVNPTTVHRNVNEENMTYSTAMKIRDAIEQAHKDDANNKGSYVPPPFVAVVSQGHYDLAVLAGRLHELDGERFGALFEKAVELMNEANKEHLLERAKHRIAHPIRRDTE